MTTRKNMMYDYILLTILLAIAFVLVAASSVTKQGAIEGLALAQNTIAPSLLPLLIIFLTIMKSGAGSALSRMFGFITVKLFNLPACAASAIIFGLIGGYPTGALVTDELLAVGDIDKRQARRMLRFCFCGGCGFIITAVGTIVIGSIRAGVVLFCSNVLSAVIIGIALSFTDSRLKYEQYSFREHMSFGDAISSATSSAVASVLNITAYVVVFSSLSSAVNIPDFIMPLVEITNGICKMAHSLPLSAAYLAFGGICIHFQLLPVMARAGMRYYDFLIFRVLCALLSYLISKMLFTLFPTEQMVFSNNSETVVSLFSVNLTLSVLMIIGCFVLVLDISSKRSSLV